MARKDTVWGARHKKEQEEIERIQEEALRRFNIDINKLEASYFQALRSSKSFMTKQEFINELRRLRSGI